MSTCKDLIVNIGNFNPANTYTVTAKLVANAADWPVIPAYTKIAVGPSVLFSTLPDGEYEVGVRVACTNADGSPAGVSNIIWQRAVTASCIVPQAYVINGITAVAAVLNWTTEALPISFQYRLDQSGDFLATSAQNTHALASLITGKVYEAEVRKKCGTYAFSQALNKNFATSVIAPTFRVDVIEKLCNGDTFEGYRLRFSITGGLAAPATYRISYTTLGGITSVVSTFTTTPGMTIYQVMLALSQVFDTSKIIVGSNYGAFDIISREPKTLPGVPANCQDINNVTGYTVALV